MLTAAAASGPAALDLTMATMQFVSSLVQQQQKLPVGFGAVCQQLMQGVRHMAMDLIQAGVLAEGLSQCVQELPAVQQVLSSAQYLPCIVLCMVLMAYGNVARQQEHLAAPRGSSSSSRRRAQANRELSQYALSLLQDREEYVLAWELGLRLQQGLTKSELRLFEMLGVDAATMLWAAAAIRQQCQPSPLVQLLRAYYDRAVSWEQSITAGANGRSAQQQQQVVTPAESDFHLLLPCVLLHAAARITETDPGFAVSCMYAGSISKAAARIWADLQESQQPGHLVWAEEYEAMEGVQFRVTKPGLMAQMPPEVVADVLPFLLDILRALLQQLQVLSAAAESSSSLLAQDHSGINPAEQEQRSAVGQLTSFLCYLLLHSTKQQQQQLSAMAAGGSSKADRSQPASSRSSSSSCCTTAAASEQVLQPHLAQVLRCMEGFVRVTAGAPAWLNQDDPESFLAVAAVGTLLNKCFSDFVQLVCRAGFGSVELLQLYSLLSSLVKACAVFGSVNPPATINVLFAAVNAAAEALMCYSSTRITAGKSTKSKTRQASVTAVGAAAADAASMLPSLVIIGRCCRLWAQHLQPQPPATVARELRRNQLMICAVGQERMGLPNLRLPMFTGPEACRDWLQRDDVSAQLSASGYDCEVLRQKVTECLEAFQEVEQADVDDPAAAGAAVTAMLPKLHALELAFSVLAIPEACNNRTCGNLRGLKEKRIVSGKGCVCSGCRVAHYCCQDCSTQHWKDHKPVCLALKAAAKSAGKQQRRRKGEVSG